MAFLISSLPVPVVFALTLKLIIMDSLGHFDDLIHRAAGGLHGAENSGIEAHAA